MRVADELGIYNSTLGNWVRAEREREEGDEQDSRPMSKREIELEEKLAKVTMERDLLR